LVTNKESKVAKIIPFEHIDINKLSDDMFAKIKADLMKNFRDAINKSDGNIPLFQAKKEAIKEVAKKYNLTFEKANEIVIEIQLRQLDKDLNL
jgi:hypothetical protein